MAKAFMKRVFSWAYSRYYIGLLILQAFNSVALTAGVYATGFNQAYGVDYLFAWVAVAGSLFSLIMVAGLVWVHSGGYSDMRGQLDRLNPFLIDKLSQKEAYYLKWWALPEKERQKKAREILKAGSFKGVLSE